MSHYRSNCLGTLEACYGCLTTKKYTTAGRFRTCTPKIIGDTLADIHGKRQLSIAATLSAHRDQPVLPIEILQTESHDLTGPQTQPRQEQQNGVVSLAHSRLPVARGQHTFSLLGRKSPGHGR